MSRQLLAIVLLLAVIGSALWYVYTLHEGRLLFLQLQELAQERDEAMAEWSRLQIEQATFAGADRVEKIAIEQLQMVAPDKLEILVLQQ